MSSTADALSQAILSLLEQQSEGAVISDIERAVTADVSRRTLLRRIGALAEAGRVIIQGETKSRRYFIGDVATPLVLSDEGLALKAEVNRPLQQREPVNYNTNFLYAYKPNETFYLSEKIRAHLKTIGQQFENNLEPGTYAKRILQRLLIDLSWNSSRLEGNTYSLLETERLIEFGAAAQGKDAFETQMIMNHKDAIEFLVEYIDEPGLSNYMVLNLHALLSNNLLANPKARGQLRNIPVGIGRTVYHPPEVPQLIEACFDLIIKTAIKIDDPFEQAFFLMVQLPYLQPFEDVNKRVSRLSANIPLIKYNLAPLSFIDVPKSDYVSGLLAIYELNKIDLMRDVFVWAYERSAKQYRLMQATLTQPDLAHMQFKDELQEIIQYIITSHIRGAEIVTAIQAWAEKNIMIAQQVRFTRLAEKEMASLHEGNIAIYRIDPVLFAKWKNA